MSLPFNLNYNLRLQMQSDRKDYALPQRTWFITGVNSGFGRIMTEHLLERGDRVAGTARKLKQLDDLKAKYGEQLRLSYLDLTDTPAIRTVVDAAFAHLGQIDVIVNNAGYGLFGAAEEVSDEQIRHQIDTNLIGSIQVIRAALPHLRAQGGGRVLQVSSTGGQFAFPTFSMYHASKWGIEGFIESVAQEVASFHIGFTIVEPGATGTNFAAGMISPPVMEIYENTPVGDVRRAVANNAFPIPGDAVKVAVAMIDSVDINPAPLRLPLGSDTYTLVRGALQQRLAALEDQKHSALSADTNPLNS